MSERTTKDTERTLDQAEDALLEYNDVTGRIAGHVQRLLEDVAPDLLSLPDAVQQQVLDLLRRGQSEEAEALLVKHGAPQTAALIGQTREARTGEPSPYLEEGTQAPADGRLPREAEVLAMLEQLAPDVLGLSPDIQDRVCDLGEAGRYAEAADLLTRHGAQKTAALLREAADRALPGTRQFQPVRFCPGCGATDLETGTYLDGTNEDGVPIYDACCRRCGWTGSVSPDEIFADDGKAGGPPAAVPGEPDALIHLLAATKSPDHVALALRALSHLTDVELGTFVRRRIEQFLETYAALDSERKTPCT